MASTPDLTSAEVEKAQAQQIETVPVSQTVVDPNNVEYVMTWKTWWVIFILSATFGLSFWPVPTTAALQTKLGAMFGDAEGTYWYIPAYTTGCALGFLLAGANSDLFGRRLFLLAGHVLCCIGFIVTAAAKGSNQFTAGLAITGFGGGFCQMAMCSIPGTLASFPNLSRFV